MAELFKTRFQRISKGLLLSIIFGGLYLVFRDTPNRIGFCSSCCGATGEKICKPNVTKQMCQEYNQQNIDGRNWVFVEKENGKCP